MVTKAAFIANPDLIDLLVLARHCPLDHRVPSGASFAAHVKGQVAPDRAVRADRGSGVHLPRTGPKAEIGGGQRADRADIGGVSRKIGVEGRIGIRDDLQTPAALKKGDHRIIGDLILEAHAAPALDAALSVE